MEIRVSEEQGRVPVTVFHIMGEMTADTAPAFEAATAQAIQNGTRDLILDLTGVPFIGSFGIRSINKALVALYEANGLTDEDARHVLRTGNKAQYLKLLNPRPEVMKVLELTGLDLLLEMHSDLRETVASFS
jgi:anti-sigma B factor antagonist